jgi:hypothetical protein
MFKKILKSINLTKKPIKCITTMKPIFILFILFIFIFMIGIKTYEGFNSDFPQSRYSPSTTTPIPTALDGTPYLSPDKNGNCPSEFERDQSNPESLCHGVCKQGNFYYKDNKAYGCVLLNKDYPQTNYSKENFPFAKDQKTNIVSPTIDATCPKYFDLDLKSGLCYTKCNGDTTFYGEVGCLKLNTKYSQTIYDASKNPYPIAADNETKYVSPTSSAKCPDDFSLDYKSGLCYTECPSGKKFSGDKSGSTIVGCN